MTTQAMIGFIGLGVMGEPMCRHLVQKSGLRVVVYDINAEPAARLEAWARGRAGHCRGREGGRDIHLAAVRRASSEGMRR